MPTHLVLPRAQQEAATKANWLENGRVKGRSHGGVGRRAGESGPRGQEEQWQNGRPERAQPEGSREEGFVEGWTNLGGEDQGQAVAK